MGIHLGVVFTMRLVILQKSQRFEEVLQVLDEMSKRKVLVNEGTHGILLNRFAAAHTVEETIGVFNRRKEFGLESDLVAFLKFLMSLYLFFFWLKIHKLNSRGNNKPIKKVPAKSKFSKITTLGGGIKKIVKFWSMSAPLRASASTHLFVSL